MKSAIIAITVGVLGASAPALADKAQVPADCVPKKKPPRKPKAPPKKTPPKRACDCVGKEGPRGPQGDKGDDGITTVKVIRQYALVERKVRPSGVRLGLGVMGAVFVPTGDWAWGPALELELPIADGTNLALEAGLAMGFTDGRENGWLGRVGLEQAKQRGFTVGLNAVSINGSDSNGQIDGYHLATDIGAIDRIDLGTFDLKVRVGFTLGYSDDERDGLGLNVGLVGSAYGTWGL